LRLTPLSPACGSCRSRKLDAWRFNAAPCSAPKSHAVIGLSSPGARAGAGSVGDWVWSRGPPLPPGGSETGLSTRALAAPHCPKALPNLGTGPEFRPSDFAPSRLQRSGIRITPGRILSFTSSRSSTTRHLAVVSLRFQNPFFLAGLSAFVSEGPIPVSMSGRCAAGAIRASAGPSSYPLSARMPVDKAG
jgi:hypothetical protein